MRLSRDRTAAAGWSGLLRFIRGDHASALLALPARFSSLSTTYQTSRAITSCLWVLTRFGEPCPALLRKTGTAMNFRRRLPEIRWLYPVCPTGYAHSQRVSPERVSTRCLLYSDAGSSPPVTDNSF